VSREGSDRRSAEIFVVSDGTGDTAANAARAAMLQFEIPWRMRTFPGVRRESHARRVVEEAAHAGALLLFTVVNKKVARELLERGAEFGVPTVDLLGPLIARFGEHLRAEPRLEPGLLHGFSDEYFRRVEAVEFAVRHDDGANPRTLFQADIVLTGVSRTSKTPLSMYLAQRGYKTGNVPLIPDLEASRELLDLNPSKVYGLVVDIETLLTVRRARVQTLGGAPYLSYVDPEAIYVELQSSRKLFRRYGWKVVDISGRAVEENAARIIELHERA
jgi:regulator of PEP synthase PpsR (kinase-PPPase family)